MRGLLFDQPIFCADRIIIQGVREKLCFSQSTANHPSPSYRCKRSVKLNSMWIYCHSYWCAIFCTTNNRSPVLTKGLQNFDNSLKKHNISLTPCSSHDYLSLSLYLSPSPSNIAGTYRKEGDRNVRVMGRFESKTWAKPNWFLPLIFWETKSKKNVIVYLERIWLYICRTLCEKKTQVYRFLVRCQENNYFTK